MPNERCDPSLTVGSLFAGIGGFCTAFMQAGFQVLWANDHNQQAVDTYQANFPQVRFLDCSVAEVSVIGHGLEKVDVLTAGFPCQPFSIAGNRMGFRDPRGHLFFEIVRLLKEFGKDRPRIVVLENVKNLMTHESGRTISRVVTEMRSAGYWISQRNMQMINTRLATDIPQNRERLFMVALSRDAYDLNAFTFPAPERETRDVRSFLDLEEPADADLYFKEDTKYGKLFYEFAEAGNADAVYQLRRSYVRESKSGSVFTLTANMGEGGHNVPVIRDAWGIRKLTPRECLRFQGFPENYYFPDSVSRTHQYRLVGNSVTVDVVLKLAIECSRLLQMQEVGT